MKPAPSPEPAAVGPAHPLRVGVLDSLPRGSRESGHSRMWANVLDRLARMPEVELRVISDRAPPDGMPHVWVADGHAALTGAGRPLVVQIHEVGWRDASQRALLSPTFVERLDRATAAAARGAELVITPSEAARSDVIAAYGVPPARVRAIPHGVDPGFHGDPIEGRRLVAERGDGRDFPYVLFVGLLHPRKNLVVLREAMARLAARGLPHRLVVVGQPTFGASDPLKLDREAEAELPGAPDRVVRIRKPADAELADLMAGAAVLCLPSLYEGFGLPALEAMACGTPVVVSDRGALPEVVADAGLVVSPDPGGVEEALSHVLSDDSLATALSRKGRERAAELTWERTARGWLEVLTEAAAAERSEPILGRS